MGDIIYTYGVEIFEVRSKNPRSQKEMAVQPKSRRQQEIDRIVRERRSLRKPLKKTWEEERKGLEALQGKTRNRLALLRRAEWLRKQHKKKERTSTAFYNDPYKFTSSFFSKEKTGTLKVLITDLEEHLRKTYSDSQRHEPISIPKDMPPIQQPEQQMDKRLPEWREVESLVRWARSASAPGPNFLVRKWLRLPRCLSNIGLYGNGALSLPIARFIKEYKSTKTRLGMMLKESCDPCVRKAPRTLATGRKCKPATMVADAKAALRHRDIVGQVQYGRGGLGLGS